MCNAVNSFLHVRSVGGKWSNTDTLKMGQYNQHQNQYISIQWNNTFDICTKKLDTYCLQELLYIAHSTASSINNADHIAASSFLYLQPTNHDKVKWGAWSLPLLIIIPLHCVDEENKADHFFPLCENNPKECDIW